ncbi:MAG: YidC/Oxa1 family membrane protein insertase [Lachnospiraceae bacterium]|nr:YidC/Oxa1 family membrane protein insertase [Lachnospiraceae bacterium]
MQLVLLTKSNTFIIGPVATFLGYIMDAIFRVTNTFGVINIALGIIIFTIVIKLLMFPMTVSQQKFSKMSAYINPEIQAIQAKYKGKKDNESLLKQNMEMNAVYDKYGSKPTAGCLPMLIQLPILFALYRVVWNIPAYVNIIKEYYVNIINTVGQSKIIELVTSEEYSYLATNNRVTVETLIGAEGTKQLNYIIDMMYNFDTKEWATFNDIIGSSLASQISEFVEKIEDMNSFFGLALYNSPWTYVTGIATYGIGLAIIACIIPLLAGGLQFLSVKISPNASGNQDQKKKLGQPEEENAMLQSMQMMTKIMPIMSIVFCFTFSTCIGIYWVMSSLVTIISQLIVNKQMDKMDVNDIVAKNMEKVNAKRAKQGLPPQKISKISNIDLKSIEKKQEEEAAKKQNYDNKIKKSTDYYNNSSSYKPGSLASKANMVKQYDEKNRK